MVIGQELLGYCLRDPDVWWQLVQNSRNRGFALVPPPEQEALVLDHVARLHAADGMPLDSTTLSAPRARQGT
jgi:hypothetical protein